MSRPGNEQIAEAFASAGTIRGAAKLLSLPESTLRGWAVTDTALAAILYAQPSPAEASRDAEVRELRRQAKSLAEIVGKRDEFLERMVDAARVPVRVPVYRRVPRTAERGALPERSIVLPIFDIQYGQLVQPSDTPFARGGYSGAIFDQRAALYLDKVGSLLSDRASQVNFTELHIVLGGDLNEGDNIYPGMAWQLEKDPIRQSLDLKVKLTHLVKELVRMAREELNPDILVALYGVPGNHGKVGGKRAGAIPGTYSWDYLTVELVVDALRAEGIDLSVNDPGGAILFETLGNVFLTIHGDEIKGQMGIPAYGLTKADGRLIRMSEVIHDYLLLGHHHQPTKLPNGSGGASLIVGDWVGPNNLSRVIMAGSRPQQTVLLMSAKHGLCTEEHVYLDGVDRSVRERAQVHSLRVA